MQSPCRVEKASTDLRAVKTANDARPNCQASNVDPLSTRLKVRWLEDKLWQIRFCVSPNPVLTVLFVGSGM